jgi:hypothetical protein
VGEEDSKITPAIPDSARFCTVAAHHRESRNGCEARQSVKFSTDRRKSWTTRPKTGPANSKQIEFARLTNDPLDIDRIELESETEGSEHRSIQEPKRMSCVQRQSQAPRLQEILRFIRNRKERPHQEKWLLSSVPLKRSFRSRL